MGVRGAHVPTDVDDVLEIVDVLADAGLGAEFAWLLRIPGLLAILAGLGLYLLTDWACWCCPPRSSPSGSCCLSSRRSW
jgi:hypothetical protein